MSLKSGRDFGARYPFLIFHGLDTEYFIYTLVSWLFSFNFSMMPLMILFSFVSAPMVILRMASSQLTTRARMNSPLLLCQKEMKDTLSASLESICALIFNCKPNTYPTLVKRKYFSGNPQIGNNYVQNLLDAN